MEFIDKAAVVAEIERRRKEAYDNEWGWAVQCVTYDEILSFLNTLEVKEVEEEPASEDLDIAASQYVTDPNNFVDWIGNHGETDDISYIIKAFQAGAKWQKEQLMSKAVDGVVHMFSDREVASVYYNDPNGVPLSFYTSSEGLSAGDKVKILVIKQE